MTEQQSAEETEALAEEFSAAELGSLLRETRSSLKRDLRDVAAELRIRLVYLQAIEDGHLENLPGPTYASGFLRAYGDYLGLDGDDLIAQFRKAGGVGGGRTDLQLPSPVEEGRLPAGSIMLLAAVLAAGAYGGWYYLSSQGRDPIEFVAALPDKFVVLVGGDEVASAPKSSLDIPSSAVAATLPEQSDGNPTDAENTAPAAESPQAASDPEPAVKKAVEQIPVASEPAVEVRPEPVQAASKQPPPLAAPEPAPISEAPKVPPPVAEAEPAPVRTVSKEPRPAREKPVQAELEPAKKAPVPAEPMPSTTRQVAANPVIPESSPATEDAPEQATPRRPTVTVAELPPPPVSVPAGRESSSDPEIVRISPRTGSSGTVSANNAPGPAGRHQIILRVNADSWVEVRLGDERPLLSRVMRAGEVYEVPARPGLKMATGNAGGIEIVVDGKLVRRLGPIGAVRRDVALDAKSLLGGSAGTP